MTGIVFREVSKEFQDGFNFAVKAIQDIYKHREGYTLEKLDETLSSIITLIDNGCWWPDIKKVITRE